MLFDCITCDKCIPICPNNGDFAFELPAGDIPIVKVRQNGNGFESRTDGTLTVAAKHQIGNFADFCNECGNCDVFYPKARSPYALKSRFFGTKADRDFFSRLDGFYFERKDGGNGDIIYGRFGGNVYCLTRAGHIGSYSGNGFALTLDVRDPLDTMEGIAALEVDMSFYQILEWIRQAVYHCGNLTYPALLA